MYGYTSARHGYIADAFPQNKDSTGDERLSAKELGDYYIKMTEDFPIVSIEDAFDQVGGNIWIFLFSCPW